MNSTESFSLFLLLFFQLYPSPMFTTLTTRNLRHTDYQQSASDSTFEIFQQLKTSWRNAGVFCQRVQSGGEREVVSSLLIYPVSSSPLTLKKNFKGSYDCCRVSCSFLGMKWKGRGVKGGGAETVSWRIRQRSIETQSKTASCVVVTKRNRGG